MAFEETISYTLVKQGLPQKGVAHRVWDFTEGKILHMLIL